MATIEKFEDLFCWQKTRKLVEIVFRITNQVAFVDSSLKNQIRRAAVSGMSNIAEGFERGTQREFLDALFIAKGELGEVRSQLVVAKMNGYTTDEDFKEAYELAKECSRLTQSFATKVKKSPYRGLQFKDI